MLCLKVVCQITVVPQLGLDKEKVDGLGGGDWGRKRGWKGRWDKQDGEERGKKGRGETSDLCVILLTFPFFHSVVTYSCMMPCSAG